MKESYGRYIVDPASLSMDRSWHVDQEAESRQFRQMQDEEDFQQVAAQSFGSLYFLKVITGRRKPTQKLEFLRLPENKNMLDLRDLKKI